MRLASPDSLSCCYQRQYSSNRLDKSSSSAPACNLPVDCPGELKAQSFQSGEADRHSFENMHCSDVEALDSSSPASPWSHHWIWEKGRMCNITSHLCAVDRRRRAGQVLQTGGFWCLWPFCQISSSSSRGEKLLSVLSGWHQILWLFPWWSQAGSVLWTHSLGLIMTWKCYTWIIEDYYNLSVKSTCKGQQWNIYFVSCTSY